MSTHVIYGTSADDDANGSNATYATARSTFAFTNLAGVASLLACGQQLNAGNYLCMESFVAFNTAEIGTGKRIRSATLAMQVAEDNSGTNFTVEARQKSWLPSVASGDWVAGASLGSQTLLASYDIASLPGINQYIDFTDAAMAANVSKTGNTEMLLCSSRHRGNNAPSGNEFVYFKSGDTTDGDGDPRLTIVAENIFPRPTGINLVRRRGIHRRRV